MSLPNEPDQGVGSNVSYDVRALLQQCWDYHERQERRRKSNQTHMTTTPVPTTNGVALSASTTIAKQLPDATHKEEEEGTSTSTNPEAQSSSFPSSSILQQQNIDAARKRARAVLEGFQKTESLSSSTTASATNFAEQRRKGFQREEERRQQAWLRNWAYLLERQPQRDAQLSEQVAASKAMLSSVEQKYQVVLEQRRKLLSSAREAISSLEPPPAPPPQRKAVRQASRTVALYWSIAPPNVVSLEESDVRQWFGPYGTIAKIVRYRNKETGLWKGDGLVVYQLLEGESRTNQSEPSVIQRQEELMDVVCGQMNGAELPNGSILHVEPAVSNHDSSQLPSQLPLEEMPKDASTPAAGMVRLPPEKMSNATLPPPVEKPGTSDPAGDSDDLDEFFDSLE